MSGQITKRKNLIEYGLIIALFYVTGGAFSYTNYSAQISIFFVIAFLLCLFTNNLKKCFKLSVIFPWLLMSFFLLLVPTIHGDSISTYIAIIMQLAIGMFCAAIIPFSNFKKRYIKVIVFFAVVSLIGFFIGVVYPRFVLQFPLTIGDASVDYYNAGIHVFMRSKGYAANELVLMNRNAGICWEPGCYQAFLNIALLFLFEEERREHQNHFFAYFVILVVTILTTVSTTGIIILSFLLVIYSKVWSRGIRFVSIFVPCAILLVFWAYNNTSFGTILQTKFDREFNEDTNFLDRISLEKAKYIFVDNGLPQLFGMSFAKWLTYKDSLWNSVIHSLLCLGIPFTAMQLMGYWRGSKRLAKNSVVLFAVMIACASTETLFWRVFFNTIAFYGWVGSLNDNVLE